MVQTPRPEPDPWRGRPLAGSRRSLQLSRISTLSSIALRSSVSRTFARCGAKDGDRSRQRPVSKDLTARALAHWLQEAHLGGLASPLRKLLASLSEKGAEPMRRVKVGSVIVREYQGKLHEVMVVPNGFCGRDRSIRVFQPSPSESPARAGAVAASSACETARARGLRQARRASQA